MIKYNCAFIAILLMTTINNSLFAQNKSAEIVKIKQAFQKINSDGSLKIKTIDDEEKFLGNATDGGGELKGYFKNDSIQKITEWVGLSFGTIQIEYYFKDDQLIFVYEIEKHFGFNDKTQETDYNKLELAFEARYYFSNEKLIEVKKKGETMESNKINFVKESKNYSKMLSAIK